MCCFSKKNKSPELEADRDQTSVRSSSIGQVDVSTSASDPTFAEAAAAEVAGARTAPGHFGLGEFEATDDSAALSAALDDLVQGDHEGQAAADPPIWQSRHTARVLGDQ